MSRLSLYKDLLLERWLGHDDICKLFIVTRYFNDGLSFDEARDYLRRSSGVDEDTPNLTAQFLLNEDISVFASFWQSLQ